MKLTSLIALGAIGAIGLVGIDRYQAHVAKVEATPVVAPKARAPRPEAVVASVEDRSWIKPRDSAPAAASAAPAPSRCDGRTHCSHMRSCEEAKYFIQHCPNTQMDGDHDGVPCEQQWC
jgi:hypothetical protein